MILKTFSSIILLLSLFSCLNLKQRTIDETERIKICRDSWTYQDLPKESEISILLFSEQFRYSISRFPNFVIGVNESYDTIAVVDKNFKGKLSEKERIIVKPTTWTDFEKETLKPVFTTYKNRTLNDLICSVKIIYYGSIEKK